MSSSQKISKAIQIDLIIADQNYRQPFEYAFSEESLQELASSINSYGLIQPVTLRAYPGKKGYYQLVAGERRLRACKLLGLQEIDAIIKELTDEDALEVCLTENLQRVDVHPLSESVVYEQMRSSGKSLLQIAAKVGKTEKFVASRLSLRELTSYWRDLFFDGGILLNGAHLVARLPKDAQEKLSQMFPRAKIEVNGKIVRPYSAAVLNDVIKQKLFLDLSKASFPLDDKELYKEAGPCYSCMDHSGYNKLLFTDVVGESDFCLKPECYHTKVARFQDKQKRMLDENGISYEEVTTGLHTDTPGVLSKYEYEVVGKGEEKLPGVKKALVVDGPTDKGKLMHIRMKNAFKGPDALELASIAEKRKENAEKKRQEKENATLTHQAILDAFKTGGRETKVKLLDYLILSRLGQRPAKELTDHLSARYGWQVKVDTSDYENRERQLEINVCSTPVERKMELFVDLFVSAMAFNENSRELYQVASLLGVEQKGEEAIRVEQTNQEAEAIPHERSLVA